MSADQERAQLLSGAFTLRQAAERLREEIAEGAPDPESRRKQADALEAEADLILQDLEGGSDA